MRLSRRPDFLSKMLKNYKHCFHDPAGVGNRSCCFARGANVFRRLCLFFSAAAFLSTRQAYRYCFSFVSRRLHHCLRLRSRSFTQSRVIIIPFILTQKDLLEKVFLLLYALIYDRDIRTEQKGCRWQPLCKLFLLFFFQ